MIKSSPSEYIRRVIRNPKCTRAYVAEIAETVEYFGLKYVLEVTWKRMFIARRSRTAERPKLGERAIWQGIESEQNCDSFKCEFDFGIARNYGKFLPQDRIL